MSPAAALLCLLAGQAPDLVLDVPVPTDGAFFEIPIVVPQGVVELQIAHRPGDDADVLDWGLVDASGAFRGYGGGNPEDIVVGELAASRGYLPGPLPVGDWILYAGKARLASAAPACHVEVWFRDAPTLPPDTERRPYAPAPPLELGARFYAGDLHVHSQDSGDARPLLDEIATFAAGRGLDFVAVTEHNTTAHVDRLGAVQARHPALLLVPGIELTTYAGHAGAFGATRWVDHRIGHRGATLEGALDGLLAQGALFILNHPSVSLGDLCIGCAWEHPVPAPGRVHAVEVGIGGWRLAGRYFDLDAIDLWERLLDAGHHLAAVGGSDDHQSGQGAQSPIGDPTTRVFAEALSVTALRQGILDSRTVVQLQGPDDPMIVLDTEPPRQGDTVHADAVTLRATVQNGVGARFRFVQNGRAVASSQAIVDDPQVFTLARQVSADDKIAPRLRAEVLVDDDGELVPRTLTSYVWLAPAPPASGCGCTAATSGSSALALVGLALVGLALGDWRRRRAGIVRCASRKNSVGNETSGSKRR